MSLLWFCVAWLIGIVLGDWLALPTDLAGFGAGCVALLGCIWWPRRDIRLPFLLAAACLLGAARLAYAQPVTTAASVWAYTGHKVIVSGVVAEQPDRREDKQTAVLTAAELTLGKDTRQVHGRVLLKLAPHPELRYGQRITVLGGLQQPKAGDEFDYRAYLARHGIYAMMSRPKLTVHPDTDEAGTWWQRATLGLNDHARRTILHLVGEPHASLMVGILLGVQSTIPDDVLDAFSATGTSHILVISGWNISVIIAGIAALLARFKVARKRSALVSGPLIVLYVLFVGASPSVVRAAVMGGLAVVATLVDRESEAWTSLLVACVAMTLPDPHVLWDIGFQLSALATAGLFAFARPIEGVLGAHRPFRWKWLAWAVEPLTATLAASLLSLPILLYHFGRLSLIAPLANVLMLPAVPYAMVFGALASVAGMLWTPLGQLLALLAWPFLQWLLLVSRLLAHVPGAYTTLPPFAVGWVWGWYLLMTVWYLWPARTTLLPRHVPSTAPEARVAQ
ncbi:MAG: ComEC family competence protein [Chloroflexota bacterium]|nr:ComEC family competence protein [Chloroflexota bacterium]